MTDSYVSSDKSDDQGQPSSSAETFTFRVEPTSIPVFITKLCLILEDTAIQEMISWSKEGERFCVFDIPGFSKIVLPRYFKHSNWPSFVRQLNMYGFHKINDSFSARHGQLICEFHHPMFYRNGRQSLRKIRRNSKRTIATTVESYSNPQQSSLQQSHNHTHNHPEQASPLHESTPIENSLVAANNPSFPTSSMPISSLLSSIKVDYNDEETTIFSDSTTNNDNTNINDNKQAIVNETRSNTDQHEYDVNSITDQKHIFFTLKRYLDQLQERTIELNGEVSLLKQHVIKQQETVIDLLNCLAKITSHCPNFRDPQSPLTSEVLSNSKVSHSTCHHHHHYHLYHHLSGPSNQIDDITYNNDINTIKKGIWDILQESKQIAKMAKKDHHMHLQPLTDKVGTIIPLSTSLGDNNNNHSRPSSPSAQSSHLNSA